MVVIAPAPPGELDLADAAGLSSGEVLSRLGTGPDGLSSDDVAERLRQFGPNALGTHRVRATAVLLRQIRNPILILLLGAALVSGLTGGGTNAVIIAVIVALSVGLGFFNEYRAEVAMAALRAKIRQEAEVRRDGRVSRVPVTEPRARRRGVAAHRRPRAGRPPPAEGRRTRVRRRRADRRVDAGGQVGGACRRPPAAGPAGMRVHGDDRPPGVGARRGGSRPEPAPPSGRSPRAWPRSRARPPSRRACRVSRASCSRWRPC